MKGSTKAQMIERSHTATVSCWMALIVRGVQRGGG
jgi:hypothetical protein